MATAAFAKCGYLRRNKAANVPPYDAPNTNNLFFCGNDKHNGYILLVRVLPFFELVKKILTSN